jgi:hypothetical protein
VIIFGNRLCRKYRKQYQHKLIRSHLRYLGRFLKVMRDLNAQVTDMKSIYHPAFYEDCIRAVNKMSAFDSSTNTYKVTTTPQLMETLLKKVGNLLITQSIGLTNKFVRFLLRCRIIPIHSFFFSALSRNLNAHLKDYVSYNLSVNFGVTNISIVRVV